MGLKLGRSQTRPKMEARKCSQTTPQQKTWSVGSQCYGQIAEDNEGATRPIKGDVDRGRGLLSDWVSWAIQLSAFASFLQFVDYPYQSVISQGERRSAYSSEDEAYTRYRLDRLLVWTGDAAVWASEFSDSGRGLSSSFS